MVLLRFEWHNPVSWKLKLPLWGLRLPSYFVLYPLIPWRLSYYDSLGSRLSPVIIIATLTVKGVHHSCRKAYEIFKTVRHFRDSPRFLPQDHEIIVKCMRPSKTIRCRRISGGDSNRKVRGLGHNTRKICMTTPLKHSENVRVQIPTPLRCSANASNAFS